MSNNNDIQGAEKKSTKPTKVGLYIPCCVDQFAAETGRRTMDLLNSMGLKCNYPTALTSCGAELYMLGDRDNAKQLGERMMELYDDCQYVVSCGSGDVAYIQKCFGKLFHNTTMHNTYRAFADKCIDLSDFLVNVMDYTPDTTVEFPHKVAVMDHCRTMSDYVCAAHRDQKGLHDELRKLLGGVKGITLLEMDDNEVCCGLGGMPAGMMTPISDGLARRKAESAINAGAEYIVSTEVSCLLHLQSYIDKNNMPLRCIYFADILKGNTGKTTE